MKSFKNAYKEQIRNGNVIDNVLEIHFPDGEFETITEENIVSESMTLKQSVCDEEKLRFGGCIASEFQIQLVNTEERSFGADLAGKWISVVLTQSFLNEGLYPDGEIYPSSALYPGSSIFNQQWYLFSGYIDSAKVDQSDRNVRTVIAYDALAKLNEADGTDKLYKLWAIDFPGSGCTLNDLLAHCLDNDVVTIAHNTSIQGCYRARLNEFLNAAEGTTVDSYKTMNKSWLESHDKITYGEIVRNVCEMLGCFGYIVADSGHGYFDFYVSSVAETYDAYEDFYAEEYTTKGYCGVILMVGVASGKESKTEKMGSARIDDNSNYYDLTNNIICWQDKDTDGLYHPFSDLYSGKETDAALAVRASYTPITATVDCRLWIEPWDTIIIKTPKTDIYGDYIYDENGDVVMEEVKSRVLSRTITGIKALTDQIEAKGVQ